MAEDLGGVMYQNIENLLMNFIRLIIKIEEINLTASYKMFDDNGIAYHRGNRRRIFNYE